MEAALIFFREKFSFTVSFSCQAVIYGGCTEIFQCAVIHGGSSDIFQCKTIIYGGNKAVIYGGNKAVICGGGADVFGVCGSSSRCGTLLRSLSRPRSLHLLKSSNYLPTPKKLAKRPQSPHILYHQHDLSCLILGSLPGKMAQQLKFDWVVTRKSSCCDPKSGRDGLKSRRDLGC
eukprot:467517-Rhodomonas_salina.1